MDDRRVRDHDRGRVLVPVNTRFKADEAGDIIARSGAKAVMIQQGFLDQDYALPSRCPACLRLSSI